MSYSDYGIFEDKYRKQFKELEEDVPELDNPLTPDEFLEAKILSDRLQSYFSKQEQKLIITNPHFKGCGFLNNCYGDLVFNETLFEIKMVNRNFRLQDCKQLLTYCALNYESKQYSIQNIALFNPRSGKLTLHNIDDFCLMISGKSSTFLFGEIVEFISGGGISR